MKNAIEKYKAYLVVERALAPNSIEAYMNDIKKFADYCIEQYVQTPQNVTSAVLNDYLIYIKTPGLMDRTEARIISSLKSFFNYLVLTGVLSENPAKQLDAPKVTRKLPNTLSQKEVDSMIGVVEMYKPEGQRNKAIIEMFYSCGLRVSELIDIKVSDINFRADTVKIEGKGHKERIVPLGKNAKTEIKQYLKAYRDYLDIPEESKDILFLSKHGSTLSRVMVFNIIKHLAYRAGITKNVSPHTLRHSFASNLVSNGADLKTVQNLLGHESILTTEIYSLNNG